MRFKVHQHIELGHHVADRIKSQANLGDKVLLMLGGGSMQQQFSSIFDEISKLFDDLSFLTISVIDERYSENPQHEHSNFEQMMAIAEIKQLINKGAQTFSVLQPGLDLQQTTKRFDSFITDKVHSDNSFLIGVMGVGTDAHLAGIMPYKSEYFQRFRKNYVVGYDIHQVSDSTNQHQYRVTLNFNGMMQLNVPALYAVGSNKYKILRKLVAMNSPTTKEISEWPVLFLHELKKDVHVYTDQYLFD